MKQVIEIIKPVRYGILLGLLGLLFGIGWAFYLVLGHESMHETLERSASGGGEEHSLIRLLEPESAQAHTHTPRQKEAGHMHEEEGEHHEGTVPEISTNAPSLPLFSKEGEGGSSGHDNPIIELSHERLTRGHIHSMGLGLATIIISLVLTFTSAPDKVKTTVSILTGIGGIIYPLAWIIMGYRTPALGPDGADISVRFIAGPGIALVALGIFTAIAYLLRDIFSEK